MVYIFDNIELTAKKGFDAISSKNIFLKIAKINTAAPIFSLTRLTNILADGVTVK